MFTATSGGTGKGCVDRDVTVYLVIRVFLRHTGLDVTHEGVDEAAALSHGVPLLLLGAAQVPTHISIIHLNPKGNTNMPGIQ